MRFVALLLALATVEQPFTSHQFVAADGTTLPYRLLAPANAQAGKRYPLVVQLHGSGAIGTDNQAQIGAFANGWLRPEIRKSFDAFVLVPQFPARTVEYAPVSDPSLTRSKALPLTDTAIALVAKIARENPVDRSRIYVIGFSMGGSTALQMITTHPDLFAAAVAFSAVPPDSTRVPASPILMIHGDADTENPFVAARAWFEAMKKAGAPRMEFRAYPGLQHELPQDALTGTWWRKWLFDHARSRRRTEWPDAVRSSARSQRLANQRLR